MSSWLRLIKQHLPRCCLKHHAGLRATLTAVDIGLKPCLLFDTATVPAAALAAWVAALTDERLVASRLEVVVVELDLFIINRAALEAHLDRIEDHPTDALLAVDVSARLEAPKIVDLQHSTNECLQACVRCLRNGPDSSGYSTVQMSESVNRTTLFGLLLGYPVLYWYDDDNAGNCLGMVTLKVMKAFLSIGVLGEGKSPSDPTTVTFNQPSLIYSFSFPEIFRQTCQTFVDRWRERLESFCKQNINCGLTFTSELISLPSVTM